MKLEIRLFSAEKVKAMLLETEGLPLHAEAMPLRAEAMLPDVVAKYPRADA